MLPEEARPLGLTPLLYGAPGGGLANRPESGPNPDRPAAEMRLSVWANYPRYIQPRAYLLLPASGPGPGLKRFLPAHVCQRHRQMNRRAEGWRIFSMVACHSCPNQRALLSVSTSAPISRKMGSCLSGKRMDDMRGLTHQRKARANKRFGDLPP